MSEIDSLVEAISTSHMIPHKFSRTGAPARRPKPRQVRPPKGGKFEVEDSYFPIRSIKVDEFDVEPTVATISSSRPLRRLGSRSEMEGKPAFRGRSGSRLRILVVEV